MQKEEFLRKLTVLYPASFYEISEKNGFKQRTPNQKYLKLYKDDLDGSDEDFQKLYNVMINKHNSVVYAPRVQWLLQELKMIKRENKSQFYTKKEVEISPPPQKFYDELEKMREKYKKRQAEKILDELKRSKIL